MFRVISPIAMRKSLFFNGSLVGRVRAQTLVAVHMTLEVEQEQGVALDELAIGAVVEFKTGHHTYRVENFGDGRVLMSGHPKYCPEPVAVYLYGSMADDRTSRVRFIGQGMRVEFRHPTLGEIRTSRVEEIKAA